MADSAQTLPRRPFRKGWRRRSGPSWHELRALAEISDAVAAVDLQNRIVYWNHTAERSYGWSAAEAMGQPLADLIRYEWIHPDDHQAFLEGMAREGRWVGEVIHHTRDGRRLRVQSTSIVVRNAAGQRVGSLAMIRDLTDLRRIEAELRHSVAELTRSNQQLAEYAHVVSHDLQEPVRMITAHLGLLQSRYQDGLDTRAHHYLDVSIQAARRIQELIRDLLAYAQLGANPRERQATPLDQPLDQALAHLRDSAEARSARITRDPMPTVPVDPSEMVQLFQNLIGNALKFCGDAPPVVHIGARREAGGWRIEVRDRGIGLEPRDQERIFEVFKRLHARESYPGNGIGLAICRQIVQRHGGELAVESRPGQGATFHFTLPDPPAQDLP
ncbi:MAG TPA: ATP-binding protein [Holophaga sp.]|nr:ATP-binding protein [Holophaga sp.]